MVKRSLTQRFFAFGLLLTFLTGALWVRAFWRSDSIIATRWVGGAPISELISFSANGYRLECDWAREHFTDGYVPGVSGRWEVTYGGDKRTLPFFIKADSSENTWRRLGFRFETALNTPGDPNRYARISFPTLLPLATFAALTLMLGRSLRRAALRNQPGMCITCGYDLRGAAHARCPECGAAVTPAAAV